MCNRLYTIPACDRQTQPDGQTDILPRHSPRYAYASRGKNGYAYHVWTTSINAFVSYPAHKQRTMTDRTNDPITRSAKMAFSLSWMAVLLLSVCTLYSVVDRVGLFVYDCYLFNFCETKND